MSTVPGDALSLHERWMAAALREAEAAAALGEVLVGAVLVSGGALLAAAGNRRETLSDPTAHAEMLALRRGAEILKGRRLSGCTLYVTLEPCPMCAGAIALAAPDLLVYGAPEYRTGCCGSVYRLTEDPGLALPRVPVIGGILSGPCAALMQDFFQSKR